MSEAEADFEIDFYGDDNIDQPQDQQNQQQQPHSAAATTSQAHQNADKANGDDQPMDDSSAPQQGTKRKPEDDGHPSTSDVEAQATTAVMISDLNWWITDDDVRGWLRAATAEDQVKNLTFSEHKVNGKSKGQVYVEFSSRTASAASKHHVETIDAGPAQKRMTVTYWNPNINPFKTLPKDAPARGKDNMNHRGGQQGGYNDRGHYGGGFRGRGRGGYNNNRGGFNNNYNNNNMGGGFNGNFGGGGFNNRGGMMGGNMRGNNMRGRGGPNMMGMNPMGMPMGMPPMGMMGGMPGFQGMGPGGFNPGFGGFNNQGQGGPGPNQGGNTGGGDWGNPHGAKRARPE